MGQKFITRESERRCSSTLKMGELGEIVSGGYCGMVVTKMYNNRFVAVFVPDHFQSHKAFKTTWDTNDLNVTVRILEKGEQVILSND